MVESREVYGGDIDVLTCGGENADGWRMYVAGDCLVENNAEVFPTALEGVWNLFRAAGNKDPTVYLEGEKMFYKYLKEQGGELSDATVLNDCIVADAQSRGSVEQADASALFLLALVLRLID
jgi:hypothetical protein